jgi:hypothetical protein
VIGRVRRLPSGRYQARYLGPDGADRPAPQTFGTKREAEVWLALKEGEIRRGNTLTAEAGASLAELMTRMGHSSTRAAKVYLHAREERDRQLADVLDRMARRELKRSGTARNADRSGTYRARGRSSGRGRGTDDHG